MKLARRTLALALGLTPGVGGKTLTRVLARNDVLGREPSRFLKLSVESLREEYRLSAKAAQTWVEQGKGLVERAMDLEARLDRFGVTLVTAADAHYPARLEQIDPDPPPVLFLHGNARLLETRTFAVLSSRNTAPAGLREIERLAEEGVLAGEVLATGHDTPEYQASAVVPLRFGAPRILVLDRGLFAALGENLDQEPFRAARLWRYQFDPGTDLAVSSTPPDTPYSARGNRDRDALVAGLALRLDFVAVAEGGNMERLARRAIQAGRPARVSDLSPGYREIAAVGAEIIPLRPT